MSSITKKMVDSFGRSSEDLRELNEIKRAANEEAKRNWDDPQYKADFAADLTESILEGFEHETFIDRLIETDRLDFNDRSFVRDARGLKAFWMARGGYIEESQMTEEVIELPRDMIGIHVSEFDDKFVTNFAESAQQLRDGAIRRMDAEVNRRVHALFQAATPSGGGNSNYASATSISAASLNAAIQQVSDNSTTGEVVIVGRPQVVDQIMDFTGYSNETLEEIRQRGVLGVYRGAPVVRLKNYKDENDTPFLPSNELWVVSRDCGKFAFYGGLKSKEFSEDANWYWHYLARRDVGVLVHHPERIYRLVDSNA